MKTDTEEAPTITAPNPAAKKPSKKNSANAVSKPFSKHPPKAATIKKTKVKAVATGNDGLSIITDSTRNRDEIIAERVTIVNGVGVLIDPKTPLDEAGIIVDKFCETERVAGLAIGDAISQLRKIHPDTFDKFMALTGRALSTLRQYSTVADAFPHELRHPSLYLGHYTPITRLTTPQKKQALKAIVKDHLDIRATRKMAKDKYPRAVKASKNGATKPSEKKGKEKADYEMSASEQAAYDRMMEPASQLAAILEEAVEKDGKTWKQLAARLPKKVSAGLRDLFKPIHKFCLALK